MIKRILLVVFLTQIEQYGSAVEFSYEGPWERCAQIHLEEAMAINKERLPLYSQISDGASEKISEALISMEEDILWIVALEDSIAQYYLNQGIPLGCADFVSMENIHPFDRVIESKETDKPFETVNGPWLSVRLEAARLKGLDNLVIAINEQLEILDKTPAYHCMLRHILESIRRTATLTPYYRTAAQEKGLISPTVLLEVIIQSQLLQLNKATWLDRMAAPLQSEGVGILCNDLPYIPAYEGLGDK